MKKSKKPLADSKEEGPDQFELPTEAPITALSTLAQFNTSKDGIMKFTNFVIQEVHGGNIEPLQIAIYMKTLEQIAKACAEVLTAKYVAEAEKYGTKTFDYRGAEITLAQHGTKYDYSVCNHRRWEAIEAIVAPLLEEQKQIEDLLKMLKGVQPMLFDDELVDVKPPRKKSKDGINIKIK